MKNNHQNIIWDWNGTLLNDIDICLEIANKMLEKQTNIPINLSQYKNAFGFPITAYYEKIGIDIQKQSFEELTEIFINNYRNGVKNCGLHNGVKRVLGQFEKADKTQFILTAAHTEMVLPLLDHFTIHDYFKEVEGVDNHRAEGKVARGLKLLENYQMDKTNTVLIGDTCHDFEVAQAMNIDCILIADGHQSKERLIDFTENKILVINEMKELIIN